MTAEPPTRDGRRNNAERRHDPRPDEGGAINALAMKAHEVGGKDRDHTHGYVGPTSTGQSESTDTQTIAGTMMASHHI